MTPLQPGAVTMLTAALLLRNSLCSITLACLLLLELQLGCTLLVHANDMHVNLTSPAVLFITDI